MPRTREINAPADLEAIRDDWWRLLAFTPDATFFQSLDWLQAYWRHFGQGQRLRVVVIEDDGQVTGIVPLVVRREVTKVGPVRFLTYPLDHWGSWYGPVSATPGKSLIAALDHVRHTRRDWDALELRFVPELDEHCEQARAALDSAGFRGPRTRLGETSLIDLEGDWGSYLAAKNSKWRNNYKRWERRLADRGEVTFQRYRPGSGGDPRWDLFDQCIEVARASWQAESNDGTTLCSERILPFLRATHEVAAAAGCVEMNLLRVDGRAIAYGYNYFFAGRIFGLRIGYDEEFSREGAGNVLYGRMIADSLARGDALYDMGPGSVDCKRHFRTRLVPIYRYSHFPRLSLRGNLLRLKRVRDEKADTKSGEQVSA